MFAGAVWAPARRRADEITQVLQTFRGNPDNLELTVDPREPL